MPSSEVLIDVELVRGLLADQHPDLADRPLVEAGAGWDNVVWRLGDDLAVRLPRREVAATLIANELEWLPTFAARLPVPVPVAIRSGQPGRSYPWRWAVVPWFEGSTALEAPPAALGALASTIGRFIAALHQVAPAQAPRNEHRGVPLAARRELTLGHLGMIERRGQRGDLDIDTARSLWLELISTPVWPGPAVWLHGDLHPGNLVLEGDELIGVIDFGDLTSGDPATDLLVAWALLPPDLRPAFRSAVGAVDDDTWRRGRAWAIAHGAVCVALGEDGSAMVSMGRQTLAAAIASD